MTTETVRERFGEPKAIDEPETIVTEPEEVWISEAFGEPEANETESWTYMHEEQDWGPTVMYSSIFLPHCMGFSALFLLPKVLFFPDEELWNCAPFMKVTRPVVLHFEAEKLVRWEVTEPIPAVSSRYDALGALKH